MIDGEHTLSVVRQSRLLGVSRSSVYYRPAPVSATVLALTRAIDVIHTARPFLGSRRIVDELEEQELHVSRKSVQRLMRLMGIEAIYQRPKTSLPGRGSAHRVYPYLLNGVRVERANQAWSADITFIPMAATIGLYESELIHARQTSWASRQGWRRQRRSGCSGSTPRGCTPRSGTSARSSSRRRTLLKCRHCRARPREERVTSEPSAVRSLIEGAGLRVRTVRENPEYRFLSKSAQGASRRFGVKSVTLLAERAA